MFAAIILIRVNRHSQSVSLDLDTPAARARVVHEKERLVAQLRSRFYSTDPFGVHATGRLQKARCRNGEWGKGKEMDALLAEWRWMYPPLAAAVKRFSQMDRASGRREFHCHHTASKRGN